MKPGFEQGVWKYLASLSVALSAGLTDPAADLMQLPQQLLERVAEETADVDFRPEDRRRTLQLLSRDRRPAVRARVAGLADSIWPVAASDAQALLRHLANDEDAQVRAGAARGLERLLERASPVDRVELVGSWATASSVGERAALASALRGSMPHLFLTDLAIEQLALDESPEVRRLAAEAASKHFDESPEMYARVLTALASDAERPIQQYARRALERIRIA